MLVIGVILVIGLPLLFLWNSAPDPHEQYLMTDEYVKSGYGKSSIFSEFKKTRELLITPKYIELTGPRSSNRIYVPEEDRWVSLRVSAAGLRTIEKRGIYAVVKELGL